MKIASVIPAVFVIIAIGAGVIVGCSRDATAPAPLNTRDAQAGNMLTAFDFSQ